MAKSVMKKMMKKEAESGVALILVKGEAKELEVDEGELMFVGGTEPNNVAFNDRKPCEDIRCTDAKLSRQTRWHSSNVRHSR